MVVRTGGPGPSRRKDFQHRFGIFMVITNISKMIGKNNVLSNRTDSPPDGGRAQRLPSTTRAVPSLGQTKGIFPRHKHKHKHRWVRAQAEQPSASRPLCPSPVPFRSGRILLGHFTEHNSRPRVALTLQPPSPDQSELFPPASSHF